MPGKEHGECRTVAFGPTRAQWISGPLFVAAACTVASIKNPGRLPILVPVVFLPAALLLWRALRLGIIRCGDSLVVRKMFTTKRLAVGDLRSWAFGPSQFPGWPKKLVIETSNGERIAVPGVSRRSSFVRQVYGEADQVGKAETRVRDLIGRRAQ